MAKNWFEPFHRLSTAHSLAVAVLGGSAVTTAIQSGIEVVKGPFLPWWGYLAVSAVLSGAIAVLLYRAKKSNRLKEPFKGSIKAFGEYWDAHRLANLSAHLSVCLVDLWHRWDNDGKKLTAPLAKTEIASWHDEELREYQAVYEYYIGLVASFLPAFQSDMMKAGFPSNDTYQKVKLSIETHTEELKRHEESQFNEFRSAASSVVPL